MMNWIRKISAVDLRSLALFRISMGLVALSDVLIRATNLTSHYTDEGVLPRISVLDSMTNSFDWSLYLFSGNKYILGFLFTLHILLVLLVLIGYRTRVSTFLTWFFLVSLHYRNPSLVHGGDEILKMLLFWSIFLPLGAVFSVDSLLNNLHHLQPETKDGIPHSLSSWSSFALLAQISIVYIFTALLKNGDSWHNGTAVYNALSINLYATPFGEYLRNFPQLLKYLTFATLILEGIFPFLIFLPFWNAPLRIIVFMAFITFHLGLYLTMYLDIFPWVCMAAWTVILPSSFWNSLGHTLKNLTDQERPLGNISTLNTLNTFPLTSLFYQIPFFFSSLFSIVSLAKFKHSLKYLQPLFPKSNGHPGSYTRTRPLKNPWPVEALCCFLILYVLIWNLRSLSINKYDKFLPESYYLPAKILKISQRWRMFAPQPLTNNGWMTIHGVQLDGKQVNILNEDQSVSGERPKEFSKNFQGRRWAKYLSELSSSKDSEKLNGFGEYICRYWNRNKKGMDRLNIFFMVFHYKYSLDPNPEAPPKDRLKWRHYCLSKPPGW